MNSQKVSTRSTQTKRAIEHLFQAQARPFSLAEIFEVIHHQLPKTAYSTVFRVVRNLENTGKVTRIDWRERGSRYEWSALPHHHHIVCQICGAMKDVDDADLNFDEEKIRHATGYIVKYHSIELEGICQNCQK